MPLSLTTQNRECRIFVQGREKRRLHFTGVKLASPHRVFATLAVGSGGKLHEI